MVTLLIVLIILFIVFGGGGYYVARPGYTGPGSGAHQILYLLAFLVVIVIVLNLLGIV